uniref:Uncharacterized protein n=1 Tax=Glossina pallidipes TaxID=7398 RepID=A0A1B0AJV1_GLOPL
MAMSRRLVFYFLGKCSVGEGKTLDDYACICSVTSSISAFGLAIVAKILTPQLLVSISLSYYCRPKTYDMFSTTALSRKKEELSLSSYRNLSVTTGVGNRFANRHSKSSDMFSNTIAHLVSGHLTFYKLLCEGVCTQSWVDIIADNVSLR